MSRPTPRPGPRSAAVVYVRLTDEERREVTEAATEQQRQAGWGGGVFAACGRDGCGVGPALALPPLSLWRLQVEVSAGAAVAGRVSGGATALVRFK